MSPSRRTTYKPPRARRETVTAVAVGAGLILFTALMVWVLGPHSSGSSTPTSPPAVSIPPSTVPKRHPTPTSTTTSRSSVSSSTSTSSPGR